MYIPESTNNRAYQIAMSRFNPRAGYESEMQQIVLKKQFQEEPNLMDKMMRDLGIGTTVDIYQ